MIKRFTWTCSVLVSCRCLGLFDRSVYISDWSHVDFCCLRVKSLPLSLQLSGHNTYVSRHSLQTHTHNPPTCVQLRALISKNKNYYQKPQVLLQAFFLKTQMSRGGLFTSGPRSARTEGQRFNVYRSVSNSWSSQSTTHTQHGCSRARSLSRGRSHWEFCDYSVNNRKRIVFSNCSRTVLSIWKSHAEPDFHMSLHRAR